MPKRQRTQKDALGERPDSRSIYLSTEVISLACRYLSLGNPPARIPGLLEQQHNISITREQIWRLITYAFRNGWLKYSPPLEQDLGERLITHFPALQHARVVVTRTMEAVADEGARHLIRLMRQHAAGTQGKRPYHLGFAGGAMLRRVARSLSEQILRDPSALPESIVFHAIVSGFNMLDPTNNPDSYFSFFSDPQALPVNTSFVGLLAPGIILRSEMKKLKTVKYIAQALDRVDEVDVFVTSAGHWRGNDSGLCRMYWDNSRPSYHQLKKAGTIGDMMWRPFSAAGPVTLETSIRAMTLLELTDLPQRIEQGRRVLLIAGPCMQCKGPRNDILEAILNQKQQYVTDLVADHRTASLLFHKPAEQ